LISAEHWDSEVFSMMLKSQAERKRALARFRLELEQEGEVNGNQ
jgi:hypothetical protein